MPPPAAPALAVGDGLFESIRVVEGRAFALDRHLGRLFSSAEALGIDLAEQEVRRAVAAALAGSSLPLARLRVLCTGTGRPGPAVVSVDVDPFEPRTAPAVVLTAPWPLDEGDPLVGHKTTAYADHVAALAAARGRGGDEAIFANRAGMLCEGTASNVFYVLDGELRTPPLAAGCLPGVTRGLVLEWCGARELEEPLELVRARASEAFLTSSTRVVQPVRRWDHRELPAAGPVTEEVRRTWEERSRALWSTPM